MSLALLRNIASGSEKNIALRILVLKALGQAIDPFSSAQERFEKKPRLPNVVRKSIISESVNDDEHGRGQAWNDERNKISGGFAIFCSRALSTIQNYELKATTKICEISQNDVRNFGCDDKISEAMSAWEDNEEIKIFREYLRIPSVHPNVDYVPCVEFLKKQAANLNLPVKVYYPVNEANPVVIITWIGQQPELPSVILNSHMDVVPVFPEEWTHPPFAAEIDAEGKIFARGSQDMKCVGMQYLGAIRALKNAGVTLKRTIHVTFVPDEEVGGKLGMAKFVLTDDFKKLNAGFSLDEGIAGADETYPVFYAERSIWHANFKISGTAGHGSLLLKNTTGVKLHYIIDKFMKFRQQEVERLEKDPNLTIGDVTTVNLTIIKGGVQSNVIPSSMEAMFDIRIAITVDHVAFENQLKQWCEEAGGGIELEYEQKEPKVPASKIDASNPYWVAFKKSVDELGLKIRTQVFPGGTDSRYIREVGIPAIGFSPMNNTPVLLHAHDEFLKADTYLQGIEIYKKIIPAVVNA